MGSESLSERKKWQMGASVTGIDGENRFVSAMAPHMPVYYEIIKKPPKIPIYDSGKGIKPDTKIINHNTGKFLYVEVKTGDRGGNATEERACKFLSPGIKRRVKEIFGDAIADKPFFFAFGGKTFSGPSFRCNNQRVDPKCYQEKVALMFEGENWAIMETDFANAEAVAHQIMDII